LQKRSLLALSSKLLTSRILVAKPYRNDRFKKALILPVSSLLRKWPHPGRAYNILLTTIAWKTDSYTELSPSFHFILFSIIQQNVYQDKSNKADIPDVVLASHLYIFISYVSQLSLFDIEMFRVRYISVDKFKAVVFNRFVVFLYMIFLLLFEPFWQCKMLTIKAAPCSANVCWDIL